MLRSEIDRRYETVHSVLWKVLQVYGEESERPSLL